MAAWLVFYAQPSPAPGRLFEARQIGQSWAPYKGPSRGDAGRSMPRLEAAASASPQAASPWNELVVAYLARGELHGDPQDVMFALASALRAVARDPAMPEARFNLALTLERFHLDAQAIRQWQNVLRGERDRGWSLEAREHLISLTAPPSSWQTAKADLAAAAAQRDQAAVRRVISAWPQACRENVEEDLLPAWGAAYLAGPGTAADQVLDAARTIAGCLLAEKHEELAAATVSGIDRSLRERDAPRSAALARGLRAYGVASALAKEGRYSDALGPLRTAWQRLKSEGSPFAARAACQIAYCQYQRYEYGAALRGLRPLTLATREQLGRALHGRALWLAGLIQSIRGDLSAGLTDLQAAAADFRALGESDHVAVMQALAAMDLADLGRQNEAWRALDAAIGSAPFTPFARTSTYSSAAWIALQEGELEVALRLQDEMLRAAGELGAHTAVAEGFCERARILTALGETAAADAALQEARHRLSRIPDLRTRRLTEGNVLRGEAQLLLTSSPLIAIGLLDRAITILRATDAHWSLAAALYARAVAERTVGRDADEARDLVAALAESERQRERITSFEQRIGFFDQHRATVDALVAFHLAHHADRQAFLVNEQARSRALLDWTLAQPAGQPAAERCCTPQMTAWPPEQLSKALPAATVLVEYRMQDAGLLLWTLRRRGLTFTRVAIEPARLAELVRGLTSAAVRRDYPALMAAASALYDILIRPISRLLPPGCRLVFAADGILHALPFAMLRDAVTGRYLVQDHASSVVPSATIFGQCLRRGRALATAGAPRVLVFADPAFDAALYHELPLLSAAAVAERIPYLLPGSRVLRDHQATLTAFLAEAGRFPIVHFGGHSVLNAGFPLLSQLLFAKETPADAGGGHGVLYSGDLLGRHFARTRLVVLASCATASGQISRTEGIESIARPFLATGVPAVVASLWQVDDTGTDDFFVHFYRHLARKDDAAVALQAAQLDALSESGAQEPFLWGAFELIGADSHP